jgi:hypothetical protein
MDPSPFASTLFFGGEGRLHTYIRPLSAGSASITGNVGFGSEPDFELPFAAVRQKIA